MSNASSEKKATLPDYLTYGLYRVLESLLRLLPMEVNCALGVALGQLGYWLMPKRRSTVVRNLRIAYGDTMQADDIHRLARKVFRTSGMNFIASVTTPLLSHEELIERLKVEGSDHLTGVLDQNKGCILLLSHMGNWELLTQFNLLYPQITLSASLYRPLNNPLLNRLIKRRRESHGTSLFSRRDGFNKPIKHLRNRGTLGVIADQSAGKHGMPVPLYGKLASMTNLPALLHRKTKAPILPLSLCTTSLGKWKIVIHPPVTVSDDELKDTYKVTARCAKAYEMVMNESPADVLWMHNYWRGANRTALKIRGVIPRHLKPSDLPFSKYFYLLIYSPVELTHETLTEILNYIRSCRPDFHITLVGSGITDKLADHVLDIDRNEPPHLAANLIVDYENSLPAPFDCALDLSPDGSGSRVLTMANIQKVFALKDHPTPAGTPGKQQPEEQYHEHLHSFITRISPSPRNSPYRSK